MKNKYWFKDCYRRNLVDMHIEDWNDEFLSKFSPEAYVENLKKAHIQAPMLYLQSHVGHCYFPTKVGHMHRAFEGREDQMRRLVDLCHENGMKVVGYYSLIYNTVEEDKHPEWALIDSADGSTLRTRGGRYGHCCPNNPDYRDFVVAQIQEMADYFELDGMFYDMTFWSGICRCEHCMKLYKEAGFDAIPTDQSASNPEFLRFMRHRMDTIGEFAKFVTDATHRIMPNVSVEHNYAFGVAGDNIWPASTELINEQCDYAGGDLYGDLYNHSFTAKYYYGVTKNQPFEYMTCRCDKSLGAHTVTKTEEYLSTEVLLTAAHHGASFIIDAIDPAGTLDARVYERIGKVFERQMPYEKYFSGEMITDVAVWYSTSGRYNRRNLPQNSKTCSVAATRALIEAHVPVAVMANTATDRAGKYKMVLAPSIAGISDKNRDEIYDYVRNGGTLYISGAEDEALLEKLLGAKLDGFTEEGAVYLAPTPAGEELFGEFNRDFPMPTDSALPKLSLDMDGVTLLATMKLPYTKAGEKRFASIHSNPPGILTDIPALLEKKLGDGRVIWSASTVEFDSRLSHRKLLWALVRKYTGKLTVETTAPRQVEVVSFERGGDKLVSAVDLLCTDELLPIRDFTVSVACEKMPTSVVRIDPDGEKPVAFDYVDGYAKFTAANLVMFAMYRVIE